MDDKSDFELPPYENNEVEKNSTNNNDKNSNNEKFTIYLPPKVDDTFQKTSNNVFFPPNLVDILSQPTLLIERQVQIYKVTLGIQQANKYHIMNPQGHVIGFMYETTSFGKALSRQALGTTRPFKFMITNLNGELLLEVKRSFTILISTINVRLPYRNHQNQLIHQEIGKSEQIFHPIKRKYRLSIKNQTQNQFDEFGHINARILAVTFPIKNKQELVIGGVDRSWTGIMREFVANSPVYVVRFDVNAPQNNIEKYYTPRGPPLDLNQRAVLLGCAISIDFDYFDSRRRRNN